MAALELVLTRDTTIKQSSRRIISSPE